MNGAVCELKTVHRHRVLGMWHDGNMANTAGNQLQQISAPPGLRVLDEPLKCDVCNNTRHFVTHAGQIHPDYALAQRAPQIKFFIQGAFLCGVLYYFLGGYSNGT